VAALLRGVATLARPVPLVTWTATSVALGWASAAGYAAHWQLAVVAVLLGGILLQGYITHGLNDLYDWDSGTDQTASGLISGGSHVLRQGLMTSRHLWTAVFVAALVYGGLLVWVVTLRGGLLAVLGVVAVVAAAAYSVPPARLCYRPLAGEWLGIFPPIVCGVLAVGIAVGVHVTALLATAALVQGVLCVASVMEHHLADVDSDWGARPQKRTSPAVWQRAYAHPGCQVALAYQLLAVALALVAAVSISPRFWWSALVAGAGAAVAFGTRTGDHADETRRDFVLKALAVVNTVGYITLAAVGVR
jgi:1,4-dihydroxy-2-naphthoate polyprenyltransferase